MYLWISRYAYISYVLGNSLARRRWWLAFTLIRNPTLVTLRVRECKTESPHRTTLSLTDIKCDDETATVDKESAESWEFSIRCCKKYKLKIPPNIFINLMAFGVLLSILVIYTGFPILLNSLLKEAQTMAMST